MNIMNVSYEIIPPTMEDLNYNYNYTNPNPAFPLLPEYTIEEIREIRMRVAIERFDSFDEYMEIPGFGKNEENGEPPEKENLEELDDDSTILYDDEVYRFKKCGEIDGCYDYSEFYESDTIVPEHEDYQLTDNERYMIRMDNDQDNDNDNDPEYWEEMRYERMVDMEQERDWDWD